jgi:uncharacterized protein YjdB
MKKTNLFKSLLLVLSAAMLPQIVFAANLCVDGLYYNFVGHSTNRTVELTYQTYQYGYPAYPNLSGNLIIPDIVSESNTDYKVIKINEYALQYCSRLTSVTIGNNVTEIGHDAFRNCTGLTGELNIPNSVTTIGPDAFTNCTGLTGELNIPNSVTSIGYRAFKGCSGLTSLIIGYSVNKIDYGTFRGCTGLTSLIIGSSVTEISDGGVEPANMPFNECTGLTSISVDSNNPKYDSRDNCNAIIETLTNSLFLGCKNTIIPNTVTSIGKVAFENCTGLTSITIPNSVTSIGNLAFYGCTGLTSVVCLIPTPLPINEGAFRGVYENADLYVLPESVNAYKSTYPWSKFNVLSVDDYVLATGISLNKTSTSLTVGETETLVATVTPSNATYKKVSWKSNNTSVATVDQNGTVTAKATGTAYITATTIDGTNLSATCKVTVTPATVLATGISLNKTSTSLTVGATETLVATVTPSNATNNAVSWESSNTSVATVDQNGKVTAKAAGTANITATTTDGTNLSATCQVTVIQMEEILIGNGTVQDEVVPIVNWEMGSYIGSECLYVKNQLAGLKAGDRITSIAFYLMSGSAKGGNFNVRMKNTSIYSLKNNASAYDTSCIEVNYNDQVNGNVTLGPYSGGQWIYFPLSTPFVYNGENIIIDIRNTTPGTRAGWCYFATTTYNGVVRRSLAWHHAKSQNPHVDGFNGGGIYDFDNSSNLPNIKISYTSIDVYATGISLNKTSTSLTVGATETLVATVTPSNVTNKTVSWKSSNTSVASVDQNGKVTAKAAGTANITATTTDGTNLSATCQVTVTPVLATGISLNMSSLSLNVGDTETLNATVTPSNATNKTVSWKSSNTSVASVDQNGKVTAKAAGAANITATTTDGTNLSATCNVTVTTQDDAGPCPSRFVYLPLTEEASRVEIELQLINSSLNLNGFNMQVQKPESAEWVMIDDIFELYSTNEGYGPNILGCWEGHTAAQMEAGLSKMMDFNTTIKEEDGQMVLVIIEILKTNNCRFFPQFSEDTPGGVAKFALDFSSCEDGVYLIKTDNTPWGCTFSYTGGPEGTKAWVADSPVELQLIKQGNTVAQVLGVNVVGVDQNVESVKYYNANGLESDTPFPGINIKVITYSDGTKVFKKILCKQ